MSSEFVERPWKNTKGKARTQRQSFDDDRPYAMTGKRGELPGKSQKSYAVIRDKAREQIKDFEACSTDDHA